MIISIFVQISPTFSSGKMKKMHKLVELCVQLLDKKLETLAKTEKEVEMKKLMGDYTMDVIASCAFAMKTDAHNDPNNQFVKNSMKIFSPETWRFLMFFIFRSLMKFLNISAMNPDATHFFENAVRFSYF